MRWLAILLLIGSSPATAAPSGSPVAIAVTHRPDGSWTADYRFGETAPAWLFVRSNPDLDGKPWRQRVWTVETPGVRLVRLGRYDAIVAPHGVPRRVRVRFTPFVAPLRADYTPALRFSDGGTALFTDQFTVAPQRSIEAVAALGFDLSTLVDRPTVLTVRDPGRRLLVDGVATTGVATLGPGHAPTYVYAGGATLVTTPSFAGVLDPGLPRWVRDELEGFLPRLLAFYADRLGKPATQRPMVLLSWGGGAQGGLSLGGSVLDGMVVMDLSGQRALAPSAPVLDRLRWFFGHEAAHFWIGHTVRYADPSGAWITEASADLLAIRALGMLAPGYDMRGEVQREVDDCVATNGTKPLAEASERGEVRANYACGAALLLAAEAATRRRDPTADAAAFVRQLIDASRADGVVTREDWLAAFTAVSGDPVLTARIAGFVHSGVADPAAFLVDLFTATGIGFTATDGKVTLT